MREKNLQSDLEAWGERERLAHTALSTDVRARLSTIRKVRRVKIGAGAGMLVTLVALLVWFAVPEDEEEAPPPPPPPATDETPDGEPIRPTVGGLSAANERFARETGALTLPRAPDLRWAHELSARR
jgi:hypothetical protein